jgi:hypothetical protein
LGYRWWKSWWRGNRWEESCRVLLEASCFCREIWRLKSSSLGRLSKQGLVLFQPHTPATASSTTIVTASQFFPTYTYQFYEIYVLGQIRYMDGQCRFLAINSPSSVVCWYLTIFHESPTHCQINDQLRTWSAVKEVVPECARQRAQQLDQSDLRFELTS